MRLCSSHIVALIPLRQWSLTKLLVGKNRITDRGTMATFWPKPAKKEVCLSKLYTNVQLCPMIYVCLHPLQFSNAGSLNCAKQLPCLRHYTPRSQLVLSVKLNGTNVPPSTKSFIVLVCLGFLFYFFCIVGYGWRILGWSCRIFLCRGDAWSYTQLVMHLKIALG